MFLATSARNIKNKNAQRRFSYIPLVYEKYKIDSTRFKESSLYYTSKIDEYEPMLKQIQELLEKERGVYARQRTVRDSIKQDSIKQVRKKKNADKSQKNVKLDDETKKKKLQQRLQKQ